jgi:hypothetical protein
MNEPDLYRQKVIELMGEYETDSYREDVGVLSEDLLQKDTNPYFEEDE